LNPSSSPPLTAAQSYPNYAVAIGASIGIPLGLLAIGLLVYLYFHYRQTHIVGPQISKTEHASWYQDAKMMRAASLSVAPEELGNETNPPQELSAGTPRLGTNS
jgi:hypothetical protein